MRLVRRYSLFDGPVKKVARYQQIAVIEDALKRIERRRPNGAREGGVVWHTQGSGKSLTMVMLARAIAQVNPQARIVIVTDRTDLDDQITTMQSSLNDYQQQLITQFAQLEAALSSNSSQASWLTSQIAALPGVTTK